eukprot:gnl/TRDRNA2_/TRDRNA2_173795_c0_seq2.p2 gnl/TRDRNA2_/TRDRNA2_173795_c0~~gnl/TRDRNA2_/TRDRNA2_173795_c0_seq2.p2  ORF type:complete len:168 (-),score=50.51 gnl/TRDRNA2_/TRDRNA2_173795_c0_seq2:155-658(-)
MQRVAPHLLLGLLVLAASCEGARADRRHGSSWKKVLAARHMATAGVPDPHCKAGVLSIPDGTDEPQACCAGYCGECTDYPTCKSVRGQDSESACCKSKVLELACGEGAAANVCLKKCSESTPPCIMDGNDFTTPDPDARTAGEDCNKAEDAWKEKADAAIEAGENPE